MRLEMEQRHWLTQWALKIVILHSLDATSVLLSVKKSHCLASILNSKMSSDNCLLFYIDSTYSDCIDTDEVVKKLLTKQQFLSLLVLCVRDF